MNYLGERVKKTIACLIIVLLVIGCKSANNQSVSQVSFFTEKNNIYVPLKDRIQNASENVISWLNDMDSTDNYNSYLLTEKENILFSDYLQLLPEKYK